MSHSATRSAAFALAPVPFLRSAHGITSSFLTRPLPSQQKRRATLHPLVTRPRTVPRATVSTEAPSTRTSKQTDTSSGHDADTVDKSQRASPIGFLFLAITFAWCSIIAVPMTLAHPFVMWRDSTRRRLHDYFFLGWMRCSLNSALMRPTIVNRANLPPKSTPTVFVANHSSFLDVLALGFLDRNMKFVSKAEVFKMPVMGWMMKLSNTIYLKRMSRRCQIECFRSMVSVVRNGMSLILFPEGTRSKTGRLNRFQGGAFKAAKQQNAPVVPITILGAREVMPAHALVPLHYPETPISLVIHPPIDTSNRSVTEIQELAYEAIESALPPEYKQDAM